MFTEEKPLDNILSDGGFCAIFRHIGCIGDSLSSGEHESTNDDGSKGYNDYYEHSWGQYMARACGSTVFNFSHGGMTAKEFNNSYADASGFDLPEKRCEAYTVALGLNDLFGLKQEVGDISDIDFEHPERNADTFAGEYAKIIQRIKRLEPKARVFLITIPRSQEIPENRATSAKANELIRKFKNCFDFSYIIDLEKYAPEYDETFKKTFYLGGHMNVCGYLLTAKYIMSYIDYIVRHNPEDFSQVGFIGKGGIHNNSAKW